MTGVLCAVWLVGVAFIVFRKARVDSGAADVLQRGLRFLHARGLPTSIDYAFVEFTANVAMWLFAIEGVVAGERGGRVGHRIGVEVFR